MVIYSKTIAASACGIACSDTPTVLLVPGVYRWRVQARLPSVWTNYSAYKVFTLLAPKAGYWVGSYPDYYVDFYVSPNRRSVLSFGLWFYVDTCHKSYKIINRSSLPIDSLGMFSFPGLFQAFGTFTGTALNSLRANGGVRL